MNPSAILLAHGGGGKMTHDLIEKLIVPAFRNPLLESRHDAAVLRVGSARIAFTTDSFVVRPLFFPGGDIGTLAINGTVNDLAMVGARPTALSAAFILEEGFSLDSLRRILESMKRAADAVGVPLVTGDTKVVDRGKGDGIFINTSGVGIVDHDLQIEPRQVRAGDAVVLSGDLGRHGTAILAAREGLQFESSIESDTAPLIEPVSTLLAAGIAIHCLRDLTRGGLISALVEISEVAKAAIRIEEGPIQIREDVRGACEILGLDPLSVANEGRFVVFLADRDVDRAVELLPGACRIGVVAEGAPGRVTMTTRLGTSRILDMFSGEQLPRIC